MTNQAAIEKLNEILFMTGYKEALDLAIKALEERPQGKWIDTGSGQECSVCHEIQYGYDNFRHFCANCGAKMVR